MKRKFVFIFGAPASGKLTTARELEKITGYNLIHNHMSSNIASRFFDFSTDDFSKLNDNLQFLIIKSVAESDTRGIIFTKFYADFKHNKFLKKIEKVLKDNNFQICYVKLDAKKKHLLKRVNSKSRKYDGKLLDKKILDRILTKNDFEDMSNRKILIIDNTKSSAKKTAQKIKEYYKLK